MTNISDQFEAVQINLDEKCFPCVCDMNKTNDHDKLFNLSKSLRLNSICDIADLCSNSVGLVLVLFLMYRRKRSFIHHKRLHGEYMKRENYRRYWCHTLRNSLVLINIFLWCLNVAEVLIRWIYSPESRLTPLVLLAPISSLINMVSVGVYYDVCERFSTHHSYLLLPMLIWCLHVLSSSGRLYEILFYYCVPIYAVAPSLYIIIGVFSVLMLILDTFTVLKWVLKDQRKESADLSKHRRQELARRKFSPKTGRGQKAFGHRQGSLSPPPSVMFDPSKLSHSGKKNEMEVGKYHHHEEEEDENTYLRKLRYCHEEEGFLSRCTFQWYIRVLRRGWESPLEFTDLDKIPEEDSSRSQYEKFQNVYEEYVESNPSTEPPLWRVFFKTYWRSLATAGILKLLGDTVNVIGPLVISPIVKFVRMIQNGTWELNGQMSHEVYFVFWLEFWLNGWVLCFLALVASILQSTFSQASSHILTTEGIHIRTALQTKIYEKSLKISVEASGHESQKLNSPSSEETKSMEAGKVINLTSEDAENVMSFFTHCHYLWAIPFKMFGLVALLWLQMGMSAVYATIAAVCFLAPVQFLLGKNIKAVNTHILEASDKRLGKTHELLILIRTVKALVLEEVFLRRVNEARSEELRVLLRDGLLRALLTFVTQASGILIILLTFGFHAMIEDVPPEEGVIFSSLALFSQLTVALFILPSIIQHTTKAIGSVNRLETFFAEPEVISSRSARHLGKISTGSIGSSKKEDVSSGEKTELNQIALLSSADFGFGRSRQKIVLRDLSTVVERGKLTIILGPVGAGKTSFLLSLLGEMTLFNGIYSWKGGNSIAYVSQKPWLLNCTLRENVLMGKTYHARKYRKILHICSLQPDIDLLPEGDSTEIGERGINLSGGQRQRVALARALYSDHPVIILDCPFSALDATVALQVFRKIYSLHQKKRMASTIILSTQHQVLCTFADKIIYLENETIKYQGAPQVISKMEPELWSKLTTSSSVDNALKGERSLIRERRTLHRQLSKISRLSKKGSRSRDLSEDLSEFLQRNGPRKQVSLLMSSPLNVLLPSDEMESVSSDPEWKRSCQVPKASLFRTTSSSPSFGRNLEEMDQRESPLDRRFARSLPPRPNRSRLSTKESNEHGHAIKRQDSVLRKLFSSSSFRKRVSQSKLAKGHWNSRILSLLFRKGFQIPEEDEAESTEEEEAEGSSDEDDCESEVFEAFIDEEERERGKISKWNYIAYLKACGWFLGGLFISLMVANQGALVALDVWLGLWSNTCVETSCEGINSSAVNTSYKLTNRALTLSYQPINSYLITFGTVSILAVSLGFLAIYMNQIAAHRGRKILHERMLKAVVGAKVKFFDLTPVGRILNRFSVDVSLIDKEIGWSVMHFLYFCLLCFSAILVNAVISPIFILASIPICLIYYIVQHVFRCSSRELKRLESLSKSPVLALITETADFPVVVRAYGLEGRFLSCYFRRMDSYLSSSVLFHAGNRWLGISLDYMGCVIVFLSTLACLVGSTTGLGSLLTPLTVGLAIKYTLAIPIYLNWLVRYLSSTEMCLNSVERVQQYTRLINEKDFPKYSKVPCCSKSKCRCRDTYKRGLPSIIEEETETANTNVAANSNEDHLIFENVFLYYDKDAEPIVTDVSLSIPFRQKVGICGRTGSGKSSLLMGILRMVEKQEGNILINGVNVEKMQLSVLRKRISVVSQESSVFRDSIRFNMDPESKFPDEALWEALDLIRLKDFVANLPNKLETEIGHGKLTMSAGQAQLLLLSRAILEKKEVVLLDEFASSLDPQTEKYLMTMLHQQLTKSTIIIVTHSIPSLMQCDRVLSIDEGKLVEDGPPAELAEKKDGIFVSLLRSAANRKSPSNSPEELSQIFLKNDGKE